jgi:eukaryotic-like serine/threonine-protein kinase
VVTGVIARSPLWLCPKGKRTMTEKIVEFLRKRDYELVRELGEGACGKTVLLYDDIIKKHLVCKKYSPYSEEKREELFAAFLREIGLLHEIHHQNVIRVFNYYLYPEILAGYILMEYVEGTDIEEYLRHAPETTNEIFAQAIQGFKYLESIQILHRDIRPQNVLVRKDGTLKVIDLGFGKRVQKPEDFGKSISLNWWCEPPAEFADSVYDFRTEVYFVGRLFERIIQEHGIEHFQHMSVLAKMCHRAPEARIPSFHEVETEIQSNRFFEIPFGDDELWCYRQFADALAGNITKIEAAAKYVDDSERIQSSLENAYRSFMLEEVVPDSSQVIKCFLAGPYYFKKQGIQVEVVREFLRLLKSCSLEKKRLIIANLHTRFNAIQRYNEPLKDEDIPF